MFARIFALLPLALLVSATHLEARDQCSTENQNCCNSVQTVRIVFLRFGLSLTRVPLRLQLDQANSLLTSCGLVDVAAAVGGLVGVTCSPITAVGLAGNSCTQQAVCCTNNDFVCLHILEIDGRQ